MFRRTSVVVAIVLSIAARLSAQERESNEAWRIIVPPQSSLVFARDGSLIGELGKEKRTIVSIRTLPRYVGQAFVAVEDQRFYQHDGVDVVGIAGALKDAVRGDPRGASTITQQLVGNMHPDLVDRRDKSPMRKLREQSAAREMEKHYNKEQILEAYLNQISFGHGWYGIESASRHYFGKGAAQLTLAEAATLASMPKGPAIYDPVKAPDRVTERRNLVLTLMAQQKYITPAQAEGTKRVPLKTVPNAGFSVDASFFLDVVRIQAERAGVPVSTGGYRAYTSLDPLLQRAANDALVAGIQDVESQQGYRHVKFASRPKGSTDYLQGALVAVDPTTGDVRALIGGRDYRESSFDRVIDGMRQPGSAFKPIVYAAAIADSLTASTIIPDTAIAIQLDRGRVYRPDNSDNQFLGPITMREALAKSRNVVAVQLAERVGMDTIVQLARRFGIDAPVAPYPASAIGASALQPLDLVGAYTVFANLGAHVDPRFIYRIEDRAGNAVFTNPAAAPRAVIDPKVAFIVRDMMREVVERGTATSVRRYLPESIPVAGKTGTTNDNSDVWFVGMTPELVAGVWLGFDKPKTITAGAAGGTLAAPIFGKMMAEYYAARSSAQWTAPQGLIAAQLDRVSGQLADSTTPPERRYTEYFLEGTEPLPLRVNGWQLFKNGPIVF
ncbi:MAG TPA: PBP1A family penicillin-binding protein [Gemmatimonadaceae bacterium]|jgi:1A family penicillin-binding protein